MHTKYVRVSFTILLVMMMATALAGIAFAAAVNPPPSGVSFTLQGCRLPIDNTTGKPLYTLPLNGLVICKNQTWVGGNDDYTTGNLGKSWNELDLVPYRIIVSTGNSAPDTSSFTFAAVLDYMDVGRPGYDVISEPTLNPGSSLGCPAPGFGPQTVTEPGLGGIDQSVYRQIDIVGVPKNKTCVYDFYGRLALGSHLFPGASLHGNLALIDPDAPGGITTSGIGARDVSIPVKEISPQELRKDMSATQGSDHIWNIFKAPTPAELSFENTCDDFKPLSAGVSIKVTWEKLPAVPGGPATVITHVYAKNPASRVITVNVTDNIYAGSTQTTLLDAANSGNVDVPANTEQLVLTHTFVWNSPTGTTLNDVATATYIDKITGVPVPGNTTATASATVQNTGPELNASAVVTDVESISGAGLSYSADSFTPAVGAFDAPYVAGTKTTGAVAWTSNTQTGNGEVTFSKTVYVAKGTIEADGHLTDTATLTASNGFTTTANADIKISVNTVASLTISKTISDVLQGNETATFSFDVIDANNQTVATTSINFAAGETTKTATVGNLTPGTYTVKETAPAGFSGQDPVTVDLSAAICNATAFFTNTANPASAKVQKITVPAGFEAGWTFDLKDGNGTILETVTTTGAGYLNFSTKLGEGSYSIVETTQPGWNSDGGVGCSFTVNLPGDADKVFACTFTNTYQPSIKLTKTGDTLSKIGDPVTYNFKLENTSSSGGPAGAPDLACTVSDPTLAFTWNATLAAGAMDTSSKNFTIPQGASDPFKNTASASCTYPGLATVVASSQSSWETNLFQPSIDVTKTGPAYSKAGDTATFYVTIKNTSSADSPDLILDSFSDSLVAGVTPPSACDTLAVGASCSFSYSYVVQAGHPDPLENTATAHYNPTGFPNDVTDASTWRTDLLEPKFTVTKACKAEPISQAGPAVFTITFNNTGDADLHVVPSEGAPFDVAAGGTLSYEYSISGPFSASVSNTVTGDVTLDPKYGLSNKYTFTASDTCDVKGKVNIIKTVSGQVPAAGQTFTFELRQDASTVADGTTLETKTTDALGNLSFSTELNPGQTYQLCEWVFPGWNTNLAGDGPLFVPNSIIPPALPNPNVNNLTVCTDFKVTSGQTRTFTVDNTPPPGGRALTIGFWKNWASCAKSNGKGQDPMLDLALGIASAQTTNPPGGLVVSAQNAGSGWPNYAPTYYLTLKGNAASTEDNILPAPDCDKAVSLLDKRNFSGKKMASDPLFNMVAQLIGAQLNRFMGAGINGATITNIDRAVLLLGKYQFNGTKYVGKLTTADTALANCLATQLDNYNNNNAVLACP